MVSSLIWLLLSCVDTCTNPLDMVPGESNLARPDKLPTSIKVRIVKLEKVMNCKILVHGRATDTGISGHFAILIPQ